MVAFRAQRVRVESKVLTVVRSLLVPCLISTGAQHFPETECRRIQTSYQLHKALDPFN